MSTFLFHMIVFVVAAWIFYALDRSVGKKWYRWWYNLSHDINLPEDVVRGFVCGRPGKTQCRVALVLSIFVVAGIATFGQGHALSWFFTAVCGFFMIMLGFMTGPLATNLWGKRKKVYDTIDRIESGEIDPSKKFKLASKKFHSNFSWLADWINIRFSNFWSGRKPEPMVVITDDPSPVSAVDPAQPAEISLPDSFLTGEANVGEQVSAEEEKPAKPEDLSPQDKIDRFTGG